MTEKKRLSTGVATQLDVSKDTLKKTIMNYDDIQNMSNKICEEALNNLIDSLKEFDENASDDVLRAFAITYFDLIITEEYDIRTLTYNIVCTPQLKDINRINTNSKEFKLLTDYSIGGDDE